MLNVASLGMRSLCEISVKNSIPAFPPFPQAFSYQLKKGVVSSLAGTLIKCYHYKIMSMDFFQAILLFVCLILSITLHEFGHAFVADKLGDSLPRRLGRVTLNPLAHAEQFGTFILPAIMIFSPVLLGGSASFIFGWGKPVPISLPNYATRKRDEILISIAGPLMNLLLALLGAVLLGMFLRYANSHEMAENVVTGTRMFLLLFMQLNLALMIFNLIPLPPLDGSRVLRYAVKMPEHVFDKLTRYSLWIMLGLILLPTPGNSILFMVLGPILRFLSSILLKLADIVSGGVLSALLQ